MVIELRNNKLEMQSVCSEALIEELDKLLEPLRIPSEVLCVPYISVLCFLQNLDKNCLAPLRKAYCQSLNLLLRREVWSNNSTELGALNDALHDLLDGIEEDFYAVVDWAYRIDPLRCISMHGITERYLSAQKADAAGFVRELLKDLQTKISTQFSRVSVV
ncbi:hypothetical protein BHM03_00017292 [Ensete ventricosum]|uniref:Uncharacterized protein n=1 Tax=Ensete ventricosum TaxID=4639 RepID=A0A445MEX6_ENSVE|nr:hypothetical protein BHM03_00017292 [Ensete ventricosum]